MIDAAVVVVVGGGGGCDVDDDGSVGIGILGATVIDAVIPSDHRNRIN